MVIGNEQKKINLIFLELKENKTEKKIQSHFNLFLTNLVDFPSCYLFCLNKKQTYLIMQ